METNQTKDNTSQTLLGVGISLAVLFATVWVIGKAWKKSQSA